MISVRKLREHGKMKSDAIESILTGTGAAAAGVGIAEGVYCIAVQSWLPGVFAVICLAVGASILACARKVRDSRDASERESADLRKHLELDADVYKRQMISITVFFALYVVVFNLFSLYIFRIDMSKLKSFDITKMEGMQNLKITKQQKFVSFVVLCGMMYSILLLFIPKSTGFYGWLSGIGQPLWFALMVSVICLFKVDNKPVVNPEQLFGKIFWGVVLAIAAFTAVGAMLSNNDLGVKTWLSVLLGPLFEDMAFPVFMPVSYTHLDVYKRQPL